MEVLRLHGTRRQSEYSNPLSLFKSLNPNKIYEYYSTLSSKFCVGVQLFLDIVQNSTKIKSSLQTELLLNMSGTQTNKELVGFFNLRPKTKPIAMMRNSANIPHKYLNTIIPPGRLCPRTAFIYSFSIWHCQ